MSSEAPHLFPAPRSIQRAGDFHALSHAPAVHRDASLPAEGYELTVADAQVSIRHSDESGRRYALDTLAQLERQYGNTVPGLRIRDWPDFPVRGYMLDVSRDRVPTRATLERIVELLARMRMNHFELYVEHTFAYRDHEVVWRNASPLTPDDIRWLDARCRASGIELVANQNTFGHMGRWLKHDAYRHLAEAPEGWQAKWGAHMSPGVLAPNESSIAFVLELLRELLPVFTSRCVNIGCDETFELGKGRSRVEVEARGRGRVYLDYLKHLTDELHRMNKQVLFWGDVMRQYPKLVGELPDNAIALVWHYEAPTDSADMPPVLFEMLADFGITREALRGFSGHVPAFADNGYPFWVCPGTSCWNTLIGRLPNARANLLDAAEVGLARGAAGYLITDWGDNGHLHPPSVSFPPLAHGAALAWCAASNRDIDVAAFLDREIFQDTTANLSSALEAAGGVYRHTGLRPMNGSPLHAHLIGQGIAALGGFLGTPDAEGLERVIDELGGAAERVGRACPLGEDGELIRRELLQAIRLARHGAWKIAREAGFSCPGTEDLRRDLREAIEEQKECWLQRSRPGGLSDSVARLERTLLTYG